MQKKTRVVQFGLGPIGSAMARHVLERPDLELVGGVEIDPQKVGRDLGDVVGADRKLGINVGDTVEAALVERQADVALHTTNSYFPQFSEQLHVLLDQGLDVVSTSEELSFPWLAHAEQAQDVDAWAKAAGKTVLGTGVNPGFIMDTLPIALTGICQRVDGVEVRRVINASTRRGPFQDKIGSGMSVEAFTEAMDAGRMGHVGLPESVGMVFTMLGRELTRYTSDVEPVVAERPTSTDHIAVEAGQVRGLKQTARGFTSDGEFVTLTFIAALDAADEGDTIQVRGVPNLRLDLHGTNGDLATVAIAVNAVFRAVDAAPGLVTMADLPVVPCVQAG